MRKFKAVLLRGDVQGSYGIGVEEMVDGKVVWFGSYYLENLQTRKNAQNEFINILEKLCEPGEQIRLNIPDRQFFERRDSFGPRFKIINGKMKQVSNCLLYCEDAMRRRTTITEKLED
jgi:hypothetical protein